MTIQEKVKKLAKLREQRKAIERAEKPLKVDVKAYMTERNIREFQAGQVKATLEACTRASLNKEAIALALGINEKALIARFGSISRYDVITLVVPKSKVRKVKR